jgi:hypothetical protein
MKERKILALSACKRMTAAVEKQSETSNKSHKSPFCPKVSLADVDLVLFMMMNARSLYDTHILASQTDMLSTLKTFNFATFNNK